MSWFKGRDKGDPKGADAEQTKEQNASDDRGMRSFADARRALRASIDLEVDKADHLLSSPKTEESIASPIETIENSNQPSDPLEVHEPIEDLKTTEPSDSAQKETSKEKAAKEEDDLEPLLDQTMSQDIQNILGKINAIQEDLENNISPENPGAILKDNLNKTQDPADVSPPPPAFQIDDIPVKEVSTDTKKVDDSLPPPSIGKLDDPNLGKSKPAEAQLSKNLIELDEAKLPDMAEIKVDIIPEEEDKSSEIVEEIDIPTMAPSQEDDLSSDPILPLTELAATVDDTKSIKLDETMTDDNKKTVSDEQEAAPAKTPATPRYINSPDAAGLEIRNLGKTYKKRPVLRDVSLNVKRGEAVGLLGPNGAGKTTCFYMICGLISADAGIISLDGQEITDLPMYRRARMGIGYLPQEASIFRGLTVEQNIRAVLEAAGGSRDEREAMLESLMEEFSISHLRRSPSVALSGGERRRLEIARALATQPHFILLDEPLAGIDPIAVRDIRELVRHLKDRGLGVLITDHNVRETLGIVDRAYILHGGNVLMEGTPDEIVRNEEVKRVYLGDEFDR